MKLQACYTPPRSQELLTQFQDTIQQLLSQEQTHGTNLERLNITGKRTLLSIRLNNKSRLLFSVIKNQDDTPCFLLLDHLPNHKYHRSKYTRGRRLEQACDEAEALIQAGEELPHISFDDSHKATQDSAFGIEGIDHAMPYRGQHIFLTDEQKAPSIKGFPGIVIGNAGSGKTLLALDLLSATPVSQTKKLYLASSERLVRGMARDYTLAQGNSEHVEFLTIEELVKRDCPDDFQAVGEEAFHEWFFNDFIKRHEWSDIKGDFDTKDSSPVYQALRVASGYERFEEYQNLGKKQSLYQNKKHRALIWAAKEAYTAHLLNNNQFDVSLHQFSEDIYNQYGQIIVDEAQDMAMGILSQLRRLAKKDQIIYLTDPRQRLNDVISHQAYLKQHIDALNHYYLNQVYRCSKEVTRFANAWLDFAKTLPGMKNKKMEVEQAAAGVDDTGTVNWFKNEKAPSIQNLFNSPDAVVITHNHLIDEARVKFGDEISMLTPEQAKGLEYDDVILYEPFRDQAYLYANQVINNKRTESEHLDATIEPAVNEIYVALTRARHAVHVVCKQTPQNKPFVQAMKQHTTQAIVDNVEAGPSAGPSKKPAVLPESTKSVELSAKEKEEKWLDRVEDFIASNQVDEAKRIFINNLNGTKEAWSKFIKNYDINLPNSSETLESTPSSSDSVIKKAEKPNPKEKDNAAVDKVEKNKQKLKVQSSHSKKSNLSQ